MEFSLQKFRPRANILKKSCSNLGPFERRYHRVELEMLLFEMVNVQLKMNDVLPPHPGRR